MQEQTQKKEPVGPGLYFGMTDEQYHALPYLSATGIKNLMISPMDYWARSNMNPWKEEDETESEAKTLGKAYHKRILEGLDAFNACYIKPLELDPTNPEHRNALKGNSEMTAWLKDMGVKGYSGKKKEELIAMIQEADPHQAIYDVLESEYAKMHAGKIFLDPVMIRKIELSAKMIECHPHLRYYFIGGYPEVSVVWFDEELQVMFKARFDYLKVNAVNDLKTFANMMNKVIEKAVYGAMASGKYHIQGALYLRAVEEAKKLAAAGHIHVLRSDATYDEEWMQAFIASPEHGFNFLFQQKGPAPVSVGAQFLRADPMFDTGIASIHQGVMIYQECMRTFGDDGTPWVDMRDPIVLSWQQYPAYASDL